MKKRLVSALLVCLMLAALLPTAVFADGTHTVTITAGTGGEVSADGQTWSGMIQIPVQDGETLGEDSFLYRPTGDTYIYDSVLRPEGIKSLAMGASFIVVLDEGGNVWTAGYNGDGQLGRKPVGGTYDDQLGRVAANVKFTAIAAGQEHTVLLDENGKVWTVGRNQGGQLGRTTSSLTDSGTLTKVTGGDIDNVTFVSASAGLMHTVLLDNQGNLWFSGKLGQLDYPGCSSKTFVKLTVEGEHSPFVKMISGQNHTLLLDSDGNVWGFGMGNYKQLGSVSADIPFTTVKKLTLPEGAGRIIDIAAQANATILLDESGNLWAAGNNQYGEIGDTSLNDPSLPTTITSITNVGRDGIPANAVIVKITAGGSATLAFDSNGCVYVRGRSNFGISSTKFVPLSDGLADTSFSDAICNLNFTALIGAGGNSFYTGGSYYDNYLLCRSEGSSALVAATANIGTPITMEELQSTPITADAAYIINFKAVKLYSLNIQRNYGEFPQGWSVPATCYGVDDALSKLPADRDILGPSVSAGLGGRKILRPWVVNRNVYAYSDTVYCICQYEEGIWLDYDGIDDDDPIRGRDRILQSDRTVSIPNPTKQGYTFAGWTVNGAGDPVKDLKLVYNNSLYVSGSTVTLTANWTANTYNITWHNITEDMFSEPLPTTYTYGVPLTLPTPTKRGHDFGGWYDNQIFLGRAVTAIEAGKTGDLDLYAQFTPSTYFISYVLDGGVNNTSNPSYYIYGTGVPTLYDASKSGYDFGGWYDNPDFSGDPITEIGPDAVVNLYLYAKFTPSTYTISYELDGGVNNDLNPDHYTYGTGVPTLYDASKSGYDFEGWYDNPDFSGDPVTEITPDAMGSLTLYAKFVRSIYYIPRYIVSVDSTVNGSAAPSPGSAARGSVVTITVRPDKGYVLETITVTDKNGNTIPANSIGGGKYTFVMPASDVVVRATFMDDNTMLNYFVDVKADSPYYDAILWAVTNGITKGTSDTTFSPDDDCTRAQIVTFLWRAAGSPVVNFPMNFTDVPADSVYAEAIRWAVSLGITTGTSDTTFSPDDTCTRAQAVTFLYRYAVSQGMDAVTLQELVSGFNDAADVPGFALPSMNWALSSGILLGAGNNLMPNDNCTRAQIVTFIYRYVK